MISSQTTVQLFYSLILLSILTLCSLQTTKAPTSTSSLFQTLLETLHPKTIIREGGYHSTYLRPRYLQSIEEDDDDEDQTIWQGEDAEEAEYPWFVELIARNGQIAGERRCAGSMLSGDTVVTLASCLYTLSGTLADPTQSIAIVKREEVQLGKGTQRNWKLMREHPDYKFGQLPNNIAVLTISGDPLFPQEDVGELATGGPAVNSTIIALGFGETYPGSGPAHTLQSAEFQILQRGRFPCNDTNNGNFMCADTVGLLGSGSKSKSSSSDGPSGDVDFCLGDEGAPFTRTDRKLYGLYIRGGKCSGEGPGAAIAIRIAPFREWILQTACEISATRCIRSCSLLSGFFLPFALAGQRVTDTAVTVWNWVSSPFRRGDQEDSSPESGSGSDKVPVRRWLKNKFFF